MRNPHSQYLTPYLNTNTQRGFGKGITPKTFLYKNLRGKARYYVDVYYRALLRALEDAEQKGEAIQGPSARGRIAWYRPVATEQTQ